MRTDLTPVPVIARMLADRMEALVAALGIQVVRRDRDDLVCLNTIRGEKNAGSFRITVSGPHAGSWRDFVDQDSLRGDALALISYVQTGRAQPGGRGAWRPAIEWAERWLGIGSAYEDRDVRRARQGAADGMAAQIEAGRQAREARARTEEQQIAQELRRLKARWLKAAELAPGTDGWTYLTQARGIDLTRLQAEGRLPQAVRCEAAAFYRWQSKDRPGPQVPTLISQLVHPQRGFAGVHITFLAEGGRDKTTLTEQDLDPAAPLDAEGKPVRVAPRKMRPRGIAGAVIPVNRGASGLPMAEAIRKGVRERIALTEGLEDALVASLAWPEMRIFAAGTLGQLGAFDPPPELCAELVVIGDNDASAANQATLRRHLQGQAGKAAGRWPVKLWRAVGAKDLGELAGMVAGAGGGQA